VDLKPFSQAAAKVLDQYLGTERIS
jgi:hypothetical protein